MRTIQVTVSGVRTQTHVIQVAAWLRRQLDTRPEVSLSITGFDSPAHRRGGRAVDLTTSDLLPSSSRLEFGSGHDAPDMYIAVGAPGIKAMIGLRRRWLGRQLSVVVIDEGLGTYGTWRTRRAALRREGSGEPIATGRAVAIAGITRIVRPERWPMYRRSGDSWTVNDVVAEEFRRHHEPVERSADVVYVSQPWVELGLVSGADYVRHLESVAAAVEATGARFVLRPHPRERADRYAGFALSHATCPAELDPEVVDARAVLGETSTALLNIASVFDTPAFRVDGPVTALLERGLGADQRSLLAAFLPPSIEPTSIEERLAEE